MILVTLRATAMSVRPYSQTPHKSGCC